MTPGVDPGAHSEALYCSIPSWLFLFVSSTFYQNPMPDLSGPSIHRKLAAISNVNTFAAIGT